MHRGYQEAEEHQEEESTDTAAGSHGGGREGRDVGRIESVSKTPWNFKRVSDPGRGAGEEDRAEVGDRGVREGVGLGVCTGPSGQCGLCEHIIEGPTHSRAPPAT